MVGQARRAVSQVAVAEKAPCHGHYVGDYEGEGCRNLEGEGLRQDNRRASGIFLSWEMSLKFYFSYLMLVKQHYREDAFTVSRVRESVASWEPSGPRGHLLGLGIAAVSGWYTPGQKLRDEKQAATPSMVFLKMHNTHLDKNAIKQVQQ